LKPGLYSSGLANADEIRSYIAEFRKSQKWIIAYGEIFTEQGYYIASACNETYLNPKGMLEFNGLSSNIVMYKGMLDKLGVNFQVFRVGKFKGAVEPFIQTKLSDENKFQIKTYLESLYTYQVKEIAKSKNTSFDSLWNIAMKGEVFTANDAKSKKLVDGLYYENQVWDVVKNKVKDYKKASVSKYLKSEDNYTYSENKIALIYAEGEIMPGTNNSEDGIGSESFIKELIKAKNDKSIKAIVIRVNSPGGSSMASDIIAQEVKLAKKVKPVIISFGNVAASGGYYISCVADSIFALPNSVTGSIGVFAMIANTENLFGQKLGLGYESVNLGEMAEIWRPDQALSPAQGMMMQKAVNEIYDDFISIVAEGRHLDKSVVNELAQGRVYSGKDALNLKLIDGLGGINRALLSASRKANVKEYRVVEFPESKSLIERFMNKANNDEAKMKSLMVEMGLNAKTVSELKSIGRMQGMQMRLPWSIEIR
jgi:protease-4